jgi:DNA polymerase III delta prime subunit
MDLNITQEEILEEIKRIKDEEKVKEIVQNQLKEFYESKDKKYLDMYWNIRGDIKYSNLSFK